MLKHSQGAPSDQVLTADDDVDRCFTTTRAQASIRHNGAIRANIDALKRLGVTDVISVSACESFRDEIAPGDFIVVDQFIDRTFAREKCLEQAVWLVFRSRTCPRLSAACVQAASDAGITVHNGGTYLAMEGPQFSALRKAKCTAAGAQM